MPWHDGQEELAIAYRIKLGEKTNRAAARFEGFKVTSYSHRSGPNDNLVVCDDVMHALARGGHTIVVDSPQGQRRRVVSIPIEVHSNNIDQIAACQLIRYMGPRKGQCVGDGRTAVLTTPSGDPERPNTREVQCPCHLSKLVNPNGPGTCKAQMTVLVSLRLPGHGTIGSRTMFRTTSPITIRRVRGGLKAVKNKIGGLLGVPLTMGVENIKTQHGSAPVAHIDLREKSIMDAQRQAADFARAIASGRDEVRQIMSGVAPLAIAPKPGDASPEEQWQVAQEFYPETAHDTSAHDPRDGYGESVCGDVGTASEID